MLCLFRELWRTNAAYIFIVTILELVEAVVGTLFSSFWFSSAMIFLFIIVQECVYYVFFMSYIQCFML